MKIKILGTGCKNCEMLYQTTLAAIKELGMNNVDVEYVKDMNEITKYIMFTPGLVINEVVVHEGKPLPTVDQVKEMIQKHGA